jgi:hypothetical protein
MVVAKVYPESERGRGKNHRPPGGFPMAKQQRLAEARTVLRYAGRSSSIFGSSANALRSLSSGMAAMRSHSLARTRFKPSSFSRLV